MSMIDPAAPDAEVPPQATPDSAEPAEPAEPAAVAAVAAVAAAPQMAPAECARELRARFPALFGDSPKPLKLRIQADIQERAPGVFTKKALSIFLHRYTGSTSYLVALSRAKQRFDLDGQPGDALSDEHRAAATAELQRRRAVHEERRAAEDAARRQRAQLLRDFETSTLTRSNFCALKGVTEEALDALLEQARAEAAEWAAQRAAQPQHDPRGPRRGPDRRDARPAGGPAGRPPRRERPDGAR
jgi:ProP effector